MRELLKILNNQRHNTQTQKCREKNNVEYDAYYRTVIMSVGLKHIFNENEPCTFKINEPTMHTSNNLVTPDAIFQCDNNRKGIVCEIKTSLPDNEQYLLGNMKDQIEKYSDIKSGWETKSGTIDEYAILLLLHRTDSKTMDSYLQQWLQSKDIVINKQICVAEWQSIRQLKVMSKDEILISHRSGTTGCTYFDDKLKKDIKLDETRIALDYERQKFVKADPPDLYLMTILYQHIFSVLANDKDHFVVTIDDLMQMLTEYYMSWSGLDGEKTQIRRRWINKAMAQFSRIGISQKIPEQPNAYDIKWSKRVPKDVQEYLLTKLCGKERKIITDYKQTKLD